MIPYSIAVEPPHGWSGIKPAQSKIGFQCQRSEARWQQNQACRERW